MTWIELIIASITGLIGLIVGAFLTYKATSTSSEEEENPSLALLSELEGRIEALERRMRSVQGYQAKTGAKIKASTRLTDEEQAFIDGLHPDERAKVMQDYLTSDSDE